MTETELRELWADDAAHDLDPFEPAPPISQLAMQCSFARARIRNRLIDVHHDMDEWEADFLLALSEIAP